MSTHCVSIIKNFNLSSKMKEEDYDHEQVIKDQPIKIFDWSSILSSSKNEESSSTSLYVHPLDKSSRNSLSEKSLEICTESLGSETGSGSDCFLSSPTSEHEDSNDDKHDHHHYYHQQQYSVVSESFEDFHVYNHSKRLISSSKSFPPSLPSIHMQSHRQNGRLILEAASISPNNSLHAQRLDGHLLLTVINQNNYEHEIEKREDEVEEFEKVFDDIQEVEGKEIPHSDSGGGDEEESKGKENESEDKKTMMKQSPRLSSEVTNVNKASIMILEKKNQLAWSKYTVSFNTTSGYIDFNSRFNNSVNLLTQEERNTNNLRECYTYPSSISHSPPQSPSPALAASTSLNAYEYFWRKKPTMTNIVNNSTITKYYYYNNEQVGVATTTNGIDTTSTKNIATYTQDLVLIKENKASIMNNNLGPLLRSCKEPRSSLIIWEPYCIPTS
uniref:Cell size regulator protein n=1 Tax=Solanum lycopersicum TaxID=4081 RepID=A0A346LVF5_SOLLC|nr:cell size regulator protein [Solanum lycopersicum]